MNAAQWLVAALQRLGVPFVSVLCGNGLDPFLAASAEGDLRLVDTRNEQADAYIADAYARLTGRLGVCAVSSAVAHINGLAGVLNAYYDGAPLLLITSASEAAGWGRGVFQDLDHSALARPICKFAENVARGDRLPHALARAVAAALSGRPGPVQLTIAIDAWLHEVRTPPAVLDAALPRDPAPCPPDAIAQALDLLAAAQRPLIVAGSGLFYAQAGPALAEFQRATAIPAVTPIWDRGVVPDPRPDYLGVVGSASGEPDLLPQADLLLLAGAQVDYRLRYLDAPPLREDLRVIRLDVDPSALTQGAPADAALAGDPARALADLAAGYAARRLPAHTAWLAEAQALHAAFYGALDRAAARQAPQPGKLTGQEIARTLAQALPAEALFLVDGGNIGQWAHLELCRQRYPAHWLTCGASGVVGWGVPGAMGVRLAQPQRPVVLLSGDGAIGFALIELASAVRQHLPFVVVLADDEAWGIVVSGQQRRRDYTTVSELGPMDYAGVANALGARGLVAHSADELARAVRQALATAVPVLIQVPTARGGPADLPVA